MITKLFTQCLAFGFTIFFGASIATAIPNCKVKGLLDGSMTIFTENSETTYTGDYTGTDIAEILIEFAENGECQLPYLADCSFSATGTGVAMYTNDLEFIDWTHHQKAREIYGTFLLHEICSLPTK